MLMKLLYVNQFVGTLEYVFLFTGQKVTQITGIMYKGLLSIYTGALRGYITIDIYDKTYILDPRNPFTNEYNHPCTSVRSYQKPLVWTLE